MSKIDQILIKRCFDLAVIGQGKTSPNPTVGSVIFDKNRIVGEGFHKAYGKAHAEVNAFNSLASSDKILSARSTIYVSLEPCNFFGKTPPCTELIKKSQIKTVIVSSIDPTPNVSGSGIEELKKAGKEVQTGILEKSGDWIQRFRAVFLKKKRPYIIVKFAKSMDGFISLKNEQTWISNLYSKRLVHKWRSHVDAILVGTNTARIDNPRLTTRNYFGRSPLRVVIDRNLSLPSDLHLFDGNDETWVFTSKKDLPDRKNVRYFSLAFDDNLIDNILEELYKASKTSLLVEGGQATLNQFLMRNLWDEARIFTGSAVLGDGVKAPAIQGKVKGVYKIADDQLHLIENKA